MEEFENPVEYEFKEDGKEFFDMFQLGKNFVVLIIQGNVQMVDLIVTIILVTYIQYGL